MMPPQRRVADFENRMRQAADVVAPGFYGRGAVVLSVVGLSLHLLSISRFTEVVAGLEFVRQVCLFGMIAIAVISIGFAIILGEVIAPVAIAVAIGSIPFSAWVFSQASGTEFVPLSGGEYYSGALVGIFYLAWKHGSPQSLLRALNIIAVTYGAIYVFLWAGITFGIIVLPETAQIVRVADVGSGRAARLVLSNTFATYGLAVAIAGIGKRFRYRDYVAAAIFITCFVMAQSRVIAALVTVGLVAYLIFRIIRVIQWTAFGIFCAGLIASMYVAFTPGTNPFSDDHYNLSEWARSQAILISQRLIPDHLAFGIGIPNGVQAYQPISFVKFFYPQDIGLVGILVSYGLAGLAVQVVIVVGACLSTRKLLRIVEPRLAIGFAMTGVILSLYSIIAPVFAATAWGSLYLALLVADVMRSELVGVDPTPNA